MDVPVLILIISRASLGRQRSGDSRRGVLEPRLAAIRSSALQSPVEQVYAGERTQQKRINFISTLFAHRHCRFGAYSN